MKCTSIKPCPFCNSNYLEIGTVLKNKHKYLAYIYCLDCGMRGPWSYVDKSVLSDIYTIVKVTGWNKRKK